MTANNRLKIGHPFDPRRWKMMEIDTAAALVDKSPRTVRRWIDGHPIDTASRKLLELYCFGCLGALYSAWEGFEIDQDEMVTPGGTRYQVNQVAAFPLTYQLNLELRKRLAEYQDAEKPDLEVKNLTSKIIPISEVFARSAKKKKPIT